MATSKYDWDFIRPLDQASGIAALTQGNQQVNTGLAAMGNAVTGYADAIKQRNTDEILNALTAAQTSADLPKAMSAVQALQQQYGRGYDQAAVRQAVDQRGSIMNQRDLQTINLQQAQAAQAAIPQLNQAAIAQGIARGIPEEQLRAYANLGIDATGQINAATNNAVSDTRYAAEAAERKANRIEDVAYRNSQANQSQRNWQADFDFREDQSNWDRAGTLSKENPATYGYAVDANGNQVTVTNPGISRLDAYGALSSVRGIRNNNPGNLGYAGQRGASRENGSGRFAAFNTPEEGLGALSNQLDLHYSGKSLKAKEAGRPLRSVQDIINAWAPPNENDTKKYIADVAKQLGVSPTANLNLKDERTKTALMRAIVQKENGGNPYTPEQYAAGIRGGSGTVRGASQAIGPVVSQANMAIHTGAYKTALAKLESDFNVQGAKDQAKGSIALTGKNVDTWAAENRGKDNTWFTSASNLASMAKQDPNFNNLPQTAQINVLNGAFAKMNNVNAFQYVSDADLKKFISTESRNYQKNRISQHNQTKAALFEQTYQSIVKEYQAIGSRAPTRDSVRQMLDPQYKAAAPKQTAQVKPQTQVKAKVEPKASPAKTEVAMDKYLRDREARKKAELEALQKSKAKVAADKVKQTKTKPTAVQTNMTKYARAGNLSQAELDKLIKNYNAR